MYLGKGDWLPGLGLLGLALALTGGVFYAALVTAERMYYTGWSSLQNNRRKRRPARRHGAKPLRLPARPAQLACPAVPAPVRAILVKDLLRLPPRPAQCSRSLITPLILGVVYAVEPVAHPAGRVPRDEAKRRHGSCKPWKASSSTATWPWRCSWAGCWRPTWPGWASRRKGKNYWMIKSAPLSQAPCSPPSSWSATCPPWWCAACILLSCKFSRARPYGRCYSAWFYWLWC